MTTWVLRQATLHPQSISLALGSVRAAMQCIGLLLGVAGLGSRGFGWTVPYHHLKGDFNTLLHRRSS